MRLYKIDNLNKYYTKYNKYKNLYISYLQIIKKCGRNWNYISYYQPLSEQFIEKYKDEVIWNYIFQYQNLSPEFKKKFWDYSMYNIY